MNIATDASGMLAIFAGITGGCSVIGYVFAIFAVNEDNRAAGVYSSILVSIALVLGGAAVLSVGNITTFALVAGAVMLAIGGLVLLVLAAVTALFASRTIRAAFA